MLSFALLLLLSSGPADDTGALAAKHFAAGEAAFKRADYTAAALAFERAYGLAPRAAALLNAAEAWEKSGMRAKAYSDCRRALLTTGISETEAAEAERRMARFRPKIGIVEVSGPAGVESDVDAGGDRQSLPAVFVVEPGQRAIILYGSGPVSGGVNPPAGATSNGVRLEERVITVAAGATVQVAFEVAPSPDPLPEVPPPSTLAPPAPPPEPAAAVVGQGPPLLSWVAFGGAGVALAAAGIFGALSLDAKTAYESAPTQERADAFFDRRTGANVCIGLAVAAAVSGAALWWFDD